MAEVVCASVATILLLTATSQGDISINPEATISDAPTNRFASFTSSDSFRIMSPSKRTSTAVSEDSPQSHIDDAISGVEFLIKAGQWQAAAAELNDALEISPSNPTVLQLAGHVALMRGELRYAASYFQQLCSLQPNNSASLAQWAAILLRLDQLKRARALLNSALEQDFYNLIARFNLAVSELALGNENIAARLLTPRRIEELGRFATWTLDDETFLRTFLSPYQFSQLCQLILAGGVTDTKPSGTTTEQLKKNLGDVASLLWQASQSIVANQYRNAIAAIHAAQELGSNAPVLAQDTAFYQFRLGHHSLAIRQLRVLTEQYPHQDAIQNTLGILLLEKGDFEAAVQAFTAAVELAPANYEAAFGLACALASLDKSVEVRTILTDLAVPHGNKFGAWLNTPAASSLRNDQRLMSWLQELLENSAP